MWLKFLRKMVVTVVEIAANFKVVAMAEINNKGGRNILSILINLYLKEFHNMSKNFNNRENFLIIFYPVVFIILSFTNFAYKYTVLIFFLILFYENFSKFNKVLLLIMNALISLEYFFGFEIYETTFTIFFIFISKVLFYYFYTFFLITFLLLIKNKIIMKNLIKKFNFQ